MCARVPSGTVTPPSSPIYPMEEAHHMRRLFVSLVAAFAFLPTLPVAALQDATPVASTPTAAIPATPVGDQLAWLLAQLNGGAATLTEEELAAHITPEFLAAFPVPLLDLLR